MKRGLQAALVTAVTVVALGAPPAAGDHSVLEQMTLGPTGAATSSDLGMLAVSDDGTAALLSSSKRYLADDTDDSSDLYLVRGGTITRITKGTTGGNGTPDYLGGKVAWTPGLDHVVFATLEALVPEDDNNWYSLYHWSEGSGLEFVHSGEIRPYAPLMTPDGEQVYFSTSDQLVPQDTDDAIDAYRLADGDLTLIGDGFPRALSADGTRLFLESPSALVAADADSGIDIYEYSGGTLRLVTTSPVASGGALNVEYQSISDDGAHVFFRTAGNLVPEDADGARWDVYDATSAGIALVSTGPGPNPCGNTNIRLLGASSAGHRAYFLTNERLVPEDVNCSQDLYRRTAGETTLLTTGPTDSEGVSTTVADLGGRVVVGTTQRLLPGDTDSSEDVYEWSNGAVTRLSNGGGARYEGASADGSRVFFRTSTAMLPSDTDAFVDLYEYAAGHLTHVTDGPRTGPDFPIGSTEISAVGDPLFITQASFGNDSDGGQADLFAARVASQGGYPRPKGATPFHVSLVPAYQACISPNRSHGPPLAFGSCAPPAQASPHLTVGTADANGQPTNSTASVRIRTLIGDPATPADEADVQITVVERDIRQSPGLGDYTGELQLELGLRATDRDDALPSGGGPATVTSADAALRATVPCQATADTTLGASCDLTTTADSLVPGAVVERRRAIWGLEQVRVLDGGPDGDAETADNAPFQVQGVFVP